MVKNKIKILHIGLSSNIGGIETVVKNWWDAIDRNQFEFDFINVENKPLAFEQEFISTGCRIYKVCSRKSNPLRSYRQLKEILSNNNYDYVHHHVMGITWPEPTIIASSIRGCKAIIHNHTVFGNSNGLTRRLLGLIGRLRLIGHPYLKMACGYESGTSVFGNGNFTIINNGINYKEKKFDEKYRKEIREKYDVDNRIILIGHVGRSCYEKNYPYFLKVFAEILKKNNGMKCMLVGDVNENQDVIALVKTLGIEGNVIFTGKVRNTERYYSAFDIFFFPSIYEGVSVSLIEAQCSGLPCIISRNIASETVISDLVRYVDIEDVSNGVDSLVNIEVQSNEARTNVNLTPEFNIENTIDKLSDFYMSNMNCCNQKTSF